MSQHEKPSMNLELYSQSFPIYYSMCCFACTHQQKNIYFFFFLPYFPYFLPVMHCQQGSLWEFLWLPLNLQVLLELLESGCPTEQIGIYFRRKHTDVSGSVWCKAEDWCKIAHGYFRASFKLTSKDLNREAYLEFQVFAGWVLDH